MPILDDSDLQSLGDLFQDLAMKDDCQISRKVSTPTSYGTTETLVVIAEVKATRKRPGTRLIQLYKDRLGDMTAWEISLPLGTDIQEADILTIGSDTMEVKVLLKQTWEVSADVIATELKG